MNDIGGKLKKTKVKIIYDKGNFKKFGLKTLLLKI